jgi:putative transposase
MPCRQNVSCRIQVAVVCNAATGTSPLPVTQPEGFVNNATRTAFACWLEPICHTQFAPVPETLVLKHTPEFSETGISNRTRQATIAHDSSHVKVLDRNHAKSANQIGRNLIEKVLPSISNADVKPSHFQALSGAAPTPFLAPAQYPAGAPQFAQGIIQRFERLDLFTVAQGSQRFQAQIDSHRGCIPRQRGPRLFHSESNKVASRIVLGYRDSARRFFDHSGPANPQPADFSEREIAVLLIPVKSRFRKLRALFITLGLESRIPRAAFKEIHISPLQMAKALLQGDAGDFPQERIFYFPLCQHSACIAIRGPFAGLLVLIPARNQSVVVRPANTAKELFKSQRLRLIRVKSKAVFDFDGDTNSIWSMVRQEDFYRGRHVVHRLSVHLVFITKYRKGAITERVWKALRVGFQTASEKLGVKLREADHNTDHVHLVIDYPPSLSVSEIVNALKGVSSRFARRDCMPELRKALWGEHFWSPSYFAASCGGAPLELIQQYVQNQRGRPSTPA